MLLRANRLAVIAGAGALLLGLVATPARPASAATGSQAPKADPYSPAYGHPYRHGAVPTIPQSGKIKSFESSQTSTASSNNHGTLSYGGGIDGIGVTSGIPKVYVVFWGSQWGTQGTNASGDLTFSNDPDVGAPYIQDLFKGLGTGGETWSGVMTQYCDGTNVLTGATACAANVAHVGYPKGGALAGVWYDSSSAEPSTATAHQIAQEAVSAAGHFGNTTAASNRYAQYFILSPTGLNPDNYESPSTGFCAWHDYNGDATLDGGGAVYSPYGDVAFTNLPYLMNLGSTCGQGAVNSPGTLDGYSIVAGHEYAETITDQNPAGGWSNNDQSSTYYGAENGDECAWITGGQGQMQDVSFSTGSFAMQSTWSNSNQTCEMTDPIILNDVVTLVSGSPQSATVGTAYTNPLVVKLTDPSGTPVEGANVTFTAPSSGALATFSSPCSGTTCVVKTDSSGLATSPQLVASSKSGSFAVTAADPTVLVPAVFSMTNLVGVASQMSIVSGTPQSTALGTAYGAPLKVRATDLYGNAVAGATVTFSAPESGASATFAACPGGNPTPYVCTVTTDSQGVATSSIPTAGSTPGSFTATASSAASPSQSFSLTNVAPPFEVAFQTTGGLLGSVGNAGFTNWGLGMAPGTSPSIMGLGGGGYEMAFQAGGGVLWTVGSAGWTDWNVGMAPGTSPSMVRLSNGGYEIALQAYGGDLWTIGTAGWTDWHLGMAPGTSPSVVALPNGGFEVAFQANGGALWTVGTAGWTDWNVGMAPGTSPSAFAPGSGGYEIAFQANGGALWTVGSAGWTDWNVGMAPGTSPATVRLSNGGYELGFQAYGGALWTIGTAGWTDWNVGMASATSPSLSALPNGGFEIAFQAGGGDLWTIGSAGWTAWPLAMAAGTGPSEA